jgi:hypothetical protein
MSRTQKNSLSALSPSNEAPHRFFTLKYLPQQIPENNFNIFPVINNNMNKDLIRYFGLFSIIPRL